MHPLILDRRKVEVVNLPPLTHAAFCVSYKKTGLTQEGLAELTDWSRQRVRRVINGEHRSMIEVDGSGKYRVPNELAIVMLGLDIGFLYEDGTKTIKQPAPISPEEFSARRNKLGVVLSQLEPLTDISRQRLSRIEQADPAANFPHGDGLRVPNTLAICMLMLEAEILTVPDGSVKD